MLKYLLPALLSFSCAAIADELKTKNLIGLYEFDVKGSELSIAAHRELSIDLNALRITGLSYLEAQEQAMLSFYGLIDGEKLIEEGEIFDERVWRVVFDQIADSNDEYDRTPMTIDRNFKFSYVNGSGRSTRRPEICEIIALNEHDGVACGSDKGIIRVVESDDGRTRIDIKIDNYPAQRYVKID